MISWTDPRYTKYVKARDEYPEGYDVVRYLHLLLRRFGILPEQPGYGARHDRHYLLDLFCGKGRLCRCIEPGLYFGVDMNWDAVRQARLDHPPYSFALLDATERTWRAHCILAWTALSMLDDEAIMPMLRKLDAYTIILGEICGRDWRTEQSDTHPGIYNRDYVEWLDLFDAAGYTLTHHESLPHAHYSTPVWAGKRDASMHTFVFSSHSRGGEWGFYKESWRKC